MAKCIVTPCISGANILRRWRWNKALAAYQTARGSVDRFREPGVKVDDLLMDSYGRLFRMLLCPAPDLPALRIKLEAAQADIFSHDDTLARVAAALVRDARRLTA